MKNIIIITVSTSSRELIRVIGVPTVRGDAPRVRVVRPAGRRVPLRRGGPSDGREHGRGCARGTRGYAHCEIRCGELVGDFYGLSYL